MKQLNSVSFQSCVIGGPVGNGVGGMVVRGVQPGDNLPRKLGRSTVGFRPAENQRVCAGSLSTGVNKHVNNKGGSRRAG